jgi:hypothetical protein
MRFARGVELEAEFRGDDDLVAHGSESLADKFLIHERTIHLRGIEQRDATIDCPSQHRYHLLLRSGDGTMSGAGSHAAQTDGGDFEATSSQSALFHVLLLGFVALSSG